MTNKTTYECKLEILAELWLNYRNDQNFEDFFAYNDLGLPLAYAINESIVTSSVLAETLVEETFSLLLAGLEIEDTGFSCLDEILSIEN